MKILKILGIVFGIYVGIIVLFESLIGYLQPEGEGTLTLSMTHPDGEMTHRVLSHIELDGVNYVAVNHWPRGWYNHIRQHPDVIVHITSEPIHATAVEVTDAGEIERIATARPLGIGFRILTGFPPRKFVRLDSKQIPAAASVMPIELDSAEAIATIKLLDDAVVAMAEATSACVQAGLTEANQCYCASPDLLSNVQTLYDETLEAYPEWQGQSVLWWADESKSYSYNLHFGGLAKQLENSCD